MSEKKYKNTPLLPKEVLNPFVTYYFNRRHIYQAACQSHGSPLWILESSVLKENARQFAAAFNRFFNKTSFYFAMKSNNHPEVSATLLESGFGLDVSSGAELQTALNLNARDIIFSGPGKTNEELALAILHRDRVTLMLDSFGELERLSALLSGLDDINSIKVGIRLTTNPNGLWRKFGIVPEKLPTFWNQVKNLSTIQFKGLQFHSSWNMTPDRQLEFITLLGNVLNNMPEDFNQSIEFIDLGGGYWPEEGEWLQFSGTPEGLDHKKMDETIEPAQNHYIIPATSLEKFSLILFEAINKNIFPYITY